NRDAGVVDNQGDLLLVGSVHAQAEQQAAGGGQLHGGGRGRRHGDRRSGTRGGPGHDRDLAEAKEAAGLTVGGDASSLEPGEEEVEGFLEALLEAGGRIPKTSRSIHGPPLPTPR